LERLIVEAEKDRTLDENQYFDYVTENDRLSAANRDIRNQQNAIDNEKEEIERRKSKADIRVKMQMDERHRLLLEKNEAMARVVDIEGEKRQREQEKEEQEARVAEFIGEASKISDRIAVDPGETAGSLDKKLDKLHDQLASAQQE
jgi:structural maintenance of chromosomes protein 6